MYSQPLKVLGMADLHDRIDMLLPVKDLDIDLIAFCGDLHNCRDRETAKSTAKALASSGPPVIIVPGNTDHKDVVPDIWREEGLEIIHNRSWRLGDIGFIGLGGMVIRDTKRLAIKKLTRYYLDDSEVYDLLARSHREISSQKYRVVLTHQPPKGARDRIYTGESTGSEGLRRFIEEFQPDLLLCGHIHEDRGEAWIGSTRIVNLGEMGRGYAALAEIGEGINIRWIEPNDSSR